MASYKQRGDSFLLIACLGYEANGKKIRKTKTYKPSPKLNGEKLIKEVEKQANLFEEDCKKGNLNKAVKFETFAREWLEEVAVMKLKRSTHSEYQNYCNRVCKSIGNKRIDEITPRDIQKYITELNDGGRSDNREGKIAPKTVKNYIAFVSAIFEHAIKMQVVSRNPCKAVTLPKVFNEEHEIYTVGEVQNILELMFQEEDKPHFALYFTLAVFTGFRRGELLGLEFRDIDFDKGSISVIRTSNYVKGKGVITDTPKTSKSKRTIQLPLAILDFLKRYREQRAEYARSLGDKWVESDRLFISWDGSPMFPNTPSKYFKRFCEKHGLRYISVHGFRHFNASVQISAGVDVKAVQMSLGHSNPMTTLSIYTHAFQSAQTVSMEKITDVVGIPKAMQ